MLLVGAASSCTDDWDEHYEVMTPATGSIWQAISEDPTLSNFQAVMKATGYDAALGGSQVFTVFAPTNDYFTEADRDAVIQLYNQQVENKVKTSRNTAIKEFVQNHIALYNYSASPAAPDTVISMMNGKKMKFTNSSFANNAFARSNVQTGNGLLFSINGQSTYSPNLFEYLDKDADLDSVRNFVYNYNNDRFVASESVPGEIVDGKINYLDSVTVMENDLMDYYSMLYAQLNDEDSSYVMLAPTNAEWERLLNINKQYFVYDKQVAEKDSFEYLQPRLAILRGAVFSATDNKNILTPGAALDSVQATVARPYSLRKLLYGSYDKKFYVYDRPNAADGIFSDAQDIALSNGVLKKTDNWKIKRSQTFMTDIVMQAESTNTLDSLNIRTTNNPRGNTLPAVVRSVPSDSKFYDKVSNNRYIEISPSGSSNITNALFDIRNVLSNVQYDVYVVFAPAEAGDSLASQSQRLPSLFRASLQCNDINGFPYYIKEAKSDGTSGDMSPVYTNNDLSRSPNNPPTAYWKDRLSPKDGVSVDSVLVGRFTFPTSSFDLENAQVKMLIDGRTSNSQVNAGTHTRTLRIDCIVFKPVYNPEDK